MRAKRVFVPPLCMALLLCALTACGNTRTKVPPTAGETNMSLQFSGVTLKWYYGSALTEPMAAAVAADFKAQTGAVVEWKNADEGGEAALKALFASGEAPDIFYLDQRLLEPWREHLMDLSGEPWVATVHEKSLECATFSGTLYGLPVAMEGIGIVYNKDLFAATGIDEVPVTLSELKAACEKLRAAGIQPFGECYSSWGFVAHTLMIPFAFEGDAPSFNKGLADGSRTWGDLAYIGNWFDYVDMTLSYGIGSSSVLYGIDDQIADFAGGKMAMITQGTWLDVPISVLNEDINYGLMPIPLSDATGQNKLITGTSNFIGVNKNTENPKVTLYFLNWLVENAQKYFIDIYGVSVPYKGVDLSNVGTLVSDMNTYIANGQTFGSFGADEWSIDFTESAAAPFQDYCAGQATRADTIQALTNMYRSSSKR